MRIAGKQRWLWTTAAMAAGFLPFAPGLAWDRLTSSTQSATAASTSTHTTAAASSKPAAEPKTADRAFELVHGSTGGRWSLPIDASTREWLVAVGISSHEPGDHRIRLSARAASRSNGSEEAPAGLRAIEPSGPKGSATRHVVARHRGTVVPERKVPPVPAKRFAIQTTNGDPADPAFYETVDARLVRTGERVAVYVDERDRETVDKATIDMIVRTMDDEIPARVESRIGGVTDIDGDGRVSILLSQVLGRMAEGKTVLDGFVRTSDFEKAGQFPRSHACDLIYLNSRVQVGPFLKSLLAHEFTHAVIASARAANAATGNPEPEESWLDEGLAHLSERWIDDNWENLDYRIADFLAATHEHRLIVNDQVGLAHGRSHGHRGAAYLFLEWCQQRFGDELPASLVRSAEAGIENLQNATGAKFEELFREWTLDLLRQSNARGKPETVREKALRGDWLVGVPRSTELVAPGDGLPAVAEWAGAGSSIRIFRISAADFESRPDVLEIVLAAPREAAVQVTAMPMSDPHAGLAMEVVPVQELRSGDVSVVRLRFTNRDRDRALKIQAAGWESLIPGLDARTLRDRRGMFDVLEIARSLGTVSLKPGQSLITAPIEIGSDRFSPVRWKAVAHDDRGQATFAWCESSSEMKSKPVSERIAADIQETAAGAVRR